MKIKCFGIVQEITQSKEIQLDKNHPQNVGQLKTWLSTQYPKIKNVASYAVAVNLEYAEDHTPLDDSSEIAIIPPVSGG